MDGWVAELQAQLFDVENQFRRISLSHIQEYLIRYLEIPKMIGIHCSDPLPQMWLVSKDREARFSTVFPSPSTSWFNLARVFLIFEFFNFSLSRGASEGK